MDFIFLSSFVVAPDLKVEVVVVATSFVTSSTTFFYSSS